MIRWLVLLRVLRAVRCADVPAFVWSGSALPDGAAYELERVSANKIGTTMTALSPKLSVLVVLPSGSAVDIAARQTGELASVMRDAISSRMFAFVEAPSESPKSVGPRFFGEESHQTVEWEDLQTKIDSATGVLVSVAPDLETFERNAVFLTNAAQKRAEALGGHHTVGLAVASGEEVATAKTSRRRLQTTTKLDGVRMTPDILTGVLVGLLFIFTVWVGIMCIGDIQTPSKYAHTGPPSLKEW